MIKKIFLIFYTLFFFQNILFSQSPNWIDQNYRSNNFSKYLYLQGFSSSSWNKKVESKENLLNRLINNAKQELIESLKINITSNSTLYTTQSNNTFDQNFNNTVNSLANEELMGLQVEKYFNEKNNQGYAFVFVEKLYLIKYYLTEIENNIQKINTLFSKEFDFKQKSQNYFYALSIIELNKFLFNKIILINSSENILKLKNINNTLDSNINKSITQLFKSLQLKSITKYVQPNLDNNFINQVEMAVYLNNSKLNDIIPFKYFMDDNDKQIFYTKTNDAATLKINLTNDNFNQTQKKIIFSLDEKGLLEKNFPFLSLFKGAFPNFILQIELKKTPIFIKNNEICSQKLLSDIKQFFIKKGFVFTANEQLSNYTIILNCSTFIKNVQELFLSYVDVDIAIKNNHNNVDIFSTKIENSKGGGATVKHATDKAFEIASTDLFESINNFFKNKNENEND